MQRDGANLQHLFLAIFYNKTGEKWKNGIFCGGKRPRNHIYIYIYIYMHTCGAVCRHNFEPFFGKAKFYMFIVSPIQSGFAVEN